MNNSRENGTESVYVVRMVKTTERFGGEPKGAAFEAVFRTPRPEHAARVRAYQMLKRDRPDENPMEWAVESVR